MAYTKTEIIEAIQEALKSPATIYAQDFIKYARVTDDPRESCTEIVANILLKNLDALNSIKVVTRKTTYKTKSHIGKTENPDSHRGEEHIAHAMFRQQMEFPFGKIIDYQTPLKNTNDNKGVGKIDLLSYDDKNLYILELKKPNSPETLLRCVLEAYTYWRTVNIQKLLWDFELPSDTIVRKAALVFENSTAHKDYGNPEIKKLMGKLGVDLFVLNQEYCGVVEAHMAWTTSKRA
jgi:hypothetical protein